MPKKLIPKNTQATILIGTPVHEVKDYALRAWLESVKNLTNYNDSEEKFDLLLVDNSQSLTYQERVKDLCHNFKIQNYKIIHLDLDTYIGNDIKRERQSTEERVAYCREEMRKELLKGSYTHLFFWESDIILPPDAFEKLIQFDNQFDVIMHDYPSRLFPTEEEWGFGATVIKRKWFTDFSFIWETENWHGGEYRLLKKIRLAGGNWVEFHNFLDIKHLANI